MWFVDPFRREALPIGQDSFWLEKERVQVHVIAFSTNGEPGESTGPHTSWFVEDIESTVQELTSLGVLSRVAFEGKNRIVWAMDPAGNTVEFQQDTA